MKVPLHLVHARRQQLADWMQQHGHVSLQEICTRFSISEATARRDLAALAADKRIVRTYGGALADYNRRFASFHERLQLASEAKCAIAKAALAFIRPKSRIFLDAGTTIYALAEALRTQPARWNGQEITVSFAYGAFELKAGDNADIAMARADEAMYAQKKASRSAAE